MHKLREWIDTTRAYAKDVELELKRISWPTRSDSTRSTLAVIAISVVLAGFLGAVDFIFSLMVKYVLA